MHVCIKLNYDAVQVRVWRNTVALFLLALPIVVVMAFVIAAVTYLPDNRPRPVRGYYFFVDLLATYSVIFHSISSDRTCMGFGALKNRPSC